MTRTAYLGLGANLGDREASLRKAIEALNSDKLRVVRESPVYETAPQEVTNQPWFLNQVIEVETALFPLQLLRRARKVEESMGRRRTVAKGPRTIDIDILFIGNKVISTPMLTVPHPAAHERRFVLAPLANLAPGLVHPVLKQSVRELLARIEGQAVKRR